MSGLVFCCCSSGRAEMLVAKTLRTLQLGNYGGILWLVVPSEEVVTYQQAVSGHPVRCVILHCEKGLVRQRKFFREQQLPGTEIVFIDDDVEAIKVLTPTGLVRCENVVGLANYVFNAMAERGDDCLLAGVYPMCNRDWQSRTVVEANAYVVGALYFCKHDVRLTEPEHDEMEDWYRCLSEQAAGRPVLRFNFIGIQTQYYKNKGGMQADRTAANRQAIVERYASEFYPIVKMVMRPGSRPDLRPRSRAVPSSVQLPVTAAPAPSDDQSTASASPP